MDEFSVVINVPSFVRFTKSTRLELKGCWGDAAREIAIEHRAVPIGGVSVPLSLRVVAIGEYASLEDANVKALAAASFLTPIISVIANASVEQPRSKLILQTNPLTTRRFAQFIIDDETSLPHEMRSIEPAWIHIFVEMMLTHADSVWIGRAITQYALAMNYWARPGWESLTVAHLFMGLEALKATALDRELRALKLTKAELAAKWSITTNQLLGEARLRLLCDNDSVVHTAAREASDGLEHGTLGYEAIAERVAISREALTKYLRKSILRLAELDPTLQQRLLGDPFGQPLLSSEMLAFSGTLSDAATWSDVVAQNYEILDVSTDVSAATYDSEADRYQVSFSAKGKAGISAQVLGMYFRPSPSNPQAPTIDSMVTKTTPTDEA